MRVIEPGHVYELDNGERLTFVRKFFPEVHDGTTTEEVLQVLINRLSTLNRDIPCEENDLALTALHNAANLLDLRTRRREAQGVEGTPYPHKSE